MPWTGPADDESRYTGGPTRRGMLAALAVGTVGITGRVAGRPGSDPERTGGWIVDRRSTSDLADGIDDGSGASDASHGQPSTGTWRLFQYEPRNTGHAPTGSGPRETAGARWGYLDGDSFEATPVVTEDTVYVADAVAREVIAVDRTDGLERWRVEANVGDGRMTYADGTLFVPADTLEARSPADGSVEWTLDLGDPRSVVVVGDYAYVATRSGAYRVNHVTAAIDWHADRVDLLAAGLAVTADKVYAVGTQYGQMIALDRATGGRSWFRRLDGAAHGAPTMHGNRVVVPTDTALVGLAYESGVPKWTYEAAVRSSVAVADDAVYATDQGEDVFALDLSTGEEQWRRSTIPGSNPPVVVGGLLYVTGTDGSVAALSPSDGSVVWRATVGGDHSDTVAVAGGELYAGDREGQLVALASGASGGLRTPTSRPTDTASPEPATDGAPATSEAPTATPTSGGAPGFGVLTGAVATGIGTIAALRRLSLADDDGE